MFICEHSVGLYEIGPSYMQWYKLCAACMNLTITQSCMCCTWKDVERLPSGVEHKRV